MRQEGKLFDGYPDMEIKDLNFTLQGSSVILRFDGSGKKVLQPGSLLLLR